MKKRGQKSEMLERRVFRLIDLGCIIFVLAVVILAIIYILVKA